MHACRQITNRFTNKTSKSLQKYFFPVHFLLIELQLTSACNEAVIEYSVVCVGFSHR